MGTAISLWRHTLGWRMLPLTERKLLKCLLSRGLRQRSCLQNLCSDADPTFVHLAVSLLWLHRLRRAGEAVTLQAVVIARVLWSPASAGCWMLLPTWPPRFFISWSCPAFHNYSKSFMLSQFYFLNEIKVPPIFQCSPQASLRGVYSSLAWRSI